MLHSLFTTVITFCQLLYEVYELCFTVYLLQLLLFVSSCMKSMSCVSQFVYYSYYFLSVLVWSLWVVFHSLFTKVITFCQFLYEVYKLCFTVCLLKLLLFVSSCMKSISCVSQFVYYSYYFLSVVVWSLWVVFHSLFTKVITFCQFLYEVYKLCFTVCLLKLLLFVSSCRKSISCVSQFAY